MRFAIIILYCFAPVLYKIFFLFLKNAYFSTTVPLKKTDISFSLNYTVNNSFYDFLQQEYPSEVYTVAIGEDNHLFSTELCGGTYVCVTIIIHTSCKQ